MLGGSSHAQSRGMSVLRIHHMLKWSMHAVIDRVVIAVECRGLSCLIFSVISTTFHLMLMSEGRSHLECFLPAGYRMAAECARDVLLQRVVDNKEDAGVLLDHRL